MQVVFVDGSSHRELDIRVNNPAATVADLMYALDPRGDPTRALLIGDRVADPDFELSEVGLHEGATIRLAPVDRGGRWPVPGADQQAEGQLELVTLNGLDAGRRFPLPTGTTVVGRAPGCDVVLHSGTVSKRHATVEVDTDGEAWVADLGSHNGTWIGGEAVPERRVSLPAHTPLMLGAVAVELRPTDVGDRYTSIDPLRHTSAAGTIPFNRPPRAAPPAPPAEVMMPKPPQTGQGRSALSLIGIMTPVLFAGVMYAVTKSTHMLLFSALTPVMGIANAIDARRKGKKTERGDKERFTRELREFREQFAGVRDDERERLAALSPDPAEIHRRVSEPSTTLWERRPNHDDFLLLRAGVGDLPWRPPLAGSGLGVGGGVGAGAGRGLRAGGGGGRGADLPEPLTEVLEAASQLEGAPIPIDLSRGGVVGIVGDRAAALGLARSLVCQAATLHGPADMPITVLAHADSGPDWDWAKWLPHTRDSSGVGRLLSHGSELSTAMVEARLREAGPPDRTNRSAPGGATPVGPTLLVVVDDESLTEGRRAPTRNLLRGEAGLVAGIVMASRVERLPALCTTVVEMLDPDGTANVARPQQGEQVAGLLAAGLADDVARDCARLMARFEDPELDIVGAGLPGSIRLLPLLDMEACTAEAVLARWKAAGVDPRPAAPIGVSEDGVFSVDFVGDGPHALVGGTTGAGKSELLRTLVAGLAAGTDPDHLTFVLVDFKGGSAFDECAKLPHTVGMVTDLDEHLAERALRCLEAELKHRERTLRTAGATDLPDYLRKHQGAEPMPRLVVIIDEFATLKAELPEFIEALVGVAQRGRSLGVHMLLATQRPQGAINDNIRANTNLRIALRVQEKADSNDIIDVPDAAAIPRTAPGRAYVRLGPNEVVAIQTALSTGPRSGGTLRHVDVAPFVYGPAPRRQAGVAGVATGARPADATGADPDGKADTDLSLLVAAIGEAFAQTRRTPPRRPWPDPLSGEIDLDDLIDQALAREANAPLGYVPFAMADDPDAQAQYPVGWVPADGNLIAYGISGAGTTTTLSSLALAMARLHSPDDLHLYALDFGAGELGELTGLPHVGAVILAAERERQTRLLRHLRSELDRRREMGAAAVRRAPAIVMLIDGWSAFVAEYNDLPGTPILDAFGRVFADGPEVRIYTVVAADRASAVAGNLASLVRQRLALRLADAHDYTAFGVRATAVPEMVPGRALIGGSGQVVQIARPADGVAVAAAQCAAGVPTPSRPPQPIEMLATAVPLAALDQVAQLDTRPWTIPVGIAEQTLAPASLVAYQGEHALIAGPARSGKSTALLTVAAVCRRARPDLTVVAVAGPRSPLADDALVDQVVHPSALGESLMPLVDGATGRLLVLVDDAEAVDDVGSVLDGLSKSDRPDLLLVAAGRNDGIRGGYSHWTRPLRRSKLGVLLRPDVDLDGDILGTHIPRRAPVAMAAGRGYVVNNGDAQLVQLALPR